VTFAVLFTGIYLVWGRGRNGLGRASQGRQLLTAPSRPRSSVSVPATRLTYGQDGRFNGCVAMLTGFGGLDDGEVKARLTLATMALIEAPARDRRDLERDRDELRRELVRRLPRHREAVLTSDDIPPGEGGATNGVREPRRPSPGGSTASAEAQASDLP
jgi:hypothetical protein